MRGGTVQINWHDLQPVLTLDFHPASRRLATGGGDHDIKIWVIGSDDSDKNLPTASYHSSFSSHSSAVNALRFSPSGKISLPVLMVVVLSFGNCIALMMARLGKCTNHYCSIKRMFLTCSGRVMVHSLFLLQLATVA